MKKRVVFIAMLLCLTFLMLGCKKKETSTGEEKTVTATLPAVVVDYSKYVDLGEYKGVEVETSAIEVTDEEVETEIQNILQENTTSEAITDRAVQDGDTVIIDFEGQIDGVAFDGGTATDYELVIGSGSFIEGFEEKLIGVKIGDTVNLDLTFPEDYGTATLAGKDTVFIVTVKSISVSVIPELNDEFATNNSDFDTAKEYTSNLKTEYQNQRKINAAWAKVLENATVKDYNQTEVDTYVEEQTTYYTQQATSSGVDFATYLVNNGATEETFKEQVTEGAKQWLDSLMVAQLIAKAEKLELTEKEYEEGLTTLSESYNITNEEFVTVNGEDKIRTALLLQKVQEYVADKAVEVETKATAEPKATTEPATAEPTTK